jgi:hypothetical protein
MRVRPDHEGETSGRLKSNRQFPYTMNQRPDYSCQTSGRSNFNYDSSLMEIRVRTVYHIVRTVDWSSLSWNLERIREPFENWVASGRAAEMSGRKQAGTEDPRYYVGVRTEGGRRPEGWYWTVSVQTDVVFCLPKYINNKINHSQ